MMAEQYRSHDPALPIRCLTAVAGPTNDLLRLFTDLRELGVAGLFVMR
jgi:hypothetical protein